MTNMSTILVKQASLNNWRELTECLHSESKIYVFFNSVVYKVFHPYYRLRREMIVDRLASTKIEGIVSPLARLVDEDSLFIGYAMEYLKGYETLSKANHFSLEEKLTIIMEIYKIYKGLRAKGISYSDIQEDNIMVKKDMFKYSIMAENPIQFIDADSVLFTDTSYESKEDTSFICWKLFTLSFSLLFGKEFKMVRYADRRTIIDCFHQFQNHNIDEIIKLFTSSQEEYYLDEHIKEIDFQKMLELYKRRK